ncbi:hypothetical protein MTO96_027641 [Rhipicephalus appendiculatus]
MAGKEGDYYKADKKEGGFLRFLCNPYTKKVLGRTGLSWFKITVFYIIFYACLSLDTIRPAWALDGSAIGTIPGLSFRPRPPVMDSNLIYFKAGTRGNWNYWVDDLQEFLKDYDRLEPDFEHLRTCSFEQPIDPEENKACRFPIENIASNCSIAQQFGYEYGQPCVLLKLNMIFGWVPEPYDNGSYPQNLPGSVKDHYDPKYVYITCEGENAADLENMGPLAYYPGNRIENFYFPYKNTTGYLSPFVFVQFVQPQRGVIINMECKAWAKNIIGSAHFELLVD